MFLTIDEMYAFLAKYQAEIEELERKVVVVKDFIAFAEAKEPVASEEVVEETEEEAETPVPEDSFQQY